MRDYGSVNRKRIAIDMDEVIADTLEKFLNVCQRGTRALA